MGFSVLASIRKIRLELAIFLTLFITYSYFHQGIQNPFIHYILPLLRGEGLILNTFGNAIIHGAVSANPMGVHESWFYPVFHPEIVQRQWNSFNLGEFFWPGSLISLLPLCCVLVLGLRALWQWSRQSITESPEPSSVAR